ncbi:MAG: alpha/beta fold hydrolase, partial [Actinobacteria bacterium]|nr:alpha/beta fold hydrolase [Actinomycetota bacterium]
MLNSALMRASIHHPSEDHMKTQSHLEIGSSKLAYRKTGEGPDIMFIHGWPLHRETWRDTVSRLPNYTCHLIDLPGTGATITPASTDVSLSGHIDAMVAAIEQLDLDDVVLVGQDSGGLIARYVTARVPERVSALVVTGTEIPFSWPAAITRLQLASRLPGSERLTMRLMNSPMFARSNLLFGGAFWNRDLLEGEFRTKVLDQTFRDREAVRRQLAVLLTFTKKLVNGLAEIHPKIS